MVSVSQAIPKINVASSSLSCSTDIYKMPIRANEYDINFYIRIDSKAIKEYLCLLLRSQILASRSRRRNLYPLQACLCLVVRCGVAVFLLVSHDG